MILGVNNVANIKKIKEKHRKMFDHYAVFVVLRVFVFTICAM
jgi:hypothetical protein